MWVQFSLQLKGYDLMVKMTNFQFVYAGSIPAIRNLIKMIFLKKKDIFLKKMLK